MSRFQELTHNGVKIYFTDFSGMSDENEINDLLDSVSVMISKHPPNSILTLNNFENIHFNKRISTKFSEITAKNKPYIKASAAYGISGLLKFMFDTIIKVTGRNMKTFTNANDAKDYLAQIGN